MSAADSGDAAFRSELAQVVDHLELAEPEPAPPEESVARRRLRRGRPQGSALARVALVRADGFLSWVYEPPRRFAARRAARGAAPLLRGDVVHEFGFEEVPPNQVTEKLVELDQRLTPKRGLRRFDGDGLVSVDRPAATPRALLLVHGTFSKGDMYLTELGATAEGEDFLARALAHYGQVLCFDHPTLSVSPLLNALDLERALGGYAGTLDVVCHSRGGLVAAWWMRIAPRKVGRVVFVGAPLEGTSLAAPARLREALDGLANIASLVQRVATAAGAFVPPAAPLLSVAAGLMKIFGGVLSIGAGTPLADAGVALVPGLAAQSRVSNNLELARLHQGPWPSAPAISAVLSNFEVGDPDAAWWEFWRRWRKPLDAIGDSAADAVFQGDNDLVVDTDSMKQLCGVPFPAAESLDFGTNDTVHHTNYFAQLRTVRFLRRTLAIP